MEDVANLVGTVKKQQTSYNNYNSEQRLLFVYYNRVKLYNAAKSGRLAGGIAERTAQKWAKRLKEDKDWNILEKQTNKVNRKTSQLQEEHKVHLINFYDEHPQARVSDAVASLTEKFENFTLKNSSVQVFLKNECNLSSKRITRHPVARNNELKLANRKAWVEEWSKTDMSFLENCAFIGESGFDINMRPPGGWSGKGTPVIVTTPSTRAISHTILGAISANFVVAMELRNPQVSKRIKIDSVGRKRKAPTNSSKRTPKGTVTGHYLQFIHKTLNEMDLFEEMKGFYLIMDNAPIHTADEISEMITERGYRCAYLPPYSPELNPIENFWSIVKNKVKRSTFDDTSDLITRTTEACNSVPPNHLRAFVQHSADTFEECKINEPI
ncbi:hypothetical protein G6F62_008114 [Rhizopus arrhizus]|nr:hypothetical protein G6F62_008114 [Rhizopus arrhizus]